LEVELPCTGGLQNSRCDIDQLNRLLDSLSPEPPTGIAEDEWDSKQLIVDRVAMIHQAVLEETLAVVTHDDDQR
jgi:hypothetical protein